jgi:hypothetical protein
MSIRLARYSASAATAISRPGISGSVVRSSMGSPSLARNPEQDLTRDKPRPGDETGPQRGLFAAPQITSSSLPAAVPPHGGRPGTTRWRDTTRQTRHAIPPDCVPPRPGPAGNWFRGHRRRH